MDGWIEVLMLATVLSWGVTSAQQFHFNLCVIQEGMVHVNHENNSNENQTLGHLFAQLITGTKALFSSTSREQAYN